jgi:hypothetical protein
VAGVRITWEWDGLESVKDKIQKIESALQPPGLTETMGQGADVFVSAAKQTAPTRSGALRSSIGKVEAEGDGAGWETGPQAGTENERGTDVMRYAKVQEDGMTINAKKDFMTFLGYDEAWHRKASVTIPPQKYMARAFAEGKDGAVAAVKQELDKKIEG